jgi:hypothetical protein
MKKFTAGRTHHTFALESFSSFSLGAFTQLPCLLQFTGSSQVIGIMCLMNISKE